MNVQEIIKLIKTKSFNMKEMAVLIPSSLVILLMLLFPPFVYNLPSPRGIFTQNGGYSFIFSPPDEYSVYFSINLSLLIVQCLIVLVISAIAMVIVRKK